MDETQFINTPDIGSGNSPQRLVRLRTLLAVAVGIVIFIAALVVIWNYVRFVSYEIILEGLSTLSLSHISAALFFTLISFGMAAFEDVLSAPKGSDSPLTKQVLSAFIANSVTNITDMGTLGGPNLRNRLFGLWSLNSIDMARLDMATQRSLTFSGVVLFVLAAIASHREIDNLVGISSLYVFGLSVAAVVGVLIYGYFSKKVGETDANRTLPSVAQFAFGAVKWLTAAGVFYACFQGAAGLPFLTVLVVFILAHSLGRLSGLPGGIGVFEAAIFILLADINPSNLIVALVSYRGIYFIIPLLLSALLIGFTKSHALNKQLIKKSARALDVYETIAPPLYAALIFLAGGAMLISAATPDRAVGLPIANGTLGLFVTELSHLIASVIASLLLIAAIGLRKRLKSAWAMCVAFLSSGSIFTILKGAEPAGAILLMVLTICLFAAKDAFYRQGRIRNIPLSWPRLGLILGAVTLAISVGLYSYLDEPYSNAIWWQFGSEGNISRFFRAFFLISIVLLFYCFWRLLQPASSPGPDETKEDIFESVKQILVSAENPGSESNLALIGDKRFLFSKSGRSFIMYGVKGRNWIAMGDPVGIQAEREELIWAFRRLADEWGAWPCFYAIRENNMNDFVDAGLALQKIGELAIISLADFTMEGKKRSELRNSKSRALREGCQFEVIQPAINSPEMDELEKVSKSWLGTHQSKEKQFSLGRFDRKVLSGQPIAIIRREGAIIAFANLWTTSDKSEVSVDLMRYEDVKINGLMDFLFTEIILWGKEQGYTQFSLGMAPLSGLAGDRLAPFMTKLGALVFEHGGRFYSFKGLRAFKQKFMPDWQPVYLAAPNQVIMPLALGNLALLSSGGILGIIQK